MRIQQNVQPTLTRSLNTGAPKAQIQTEEPQGPQEQVNLSKDPQGPQPGKPWGKILVRTAVSAGFGALMGAGMAGGGVGGFIAGGLGGSVLGLKVLGPAGNGKGADGLLYAGAGLVLGGVAGAWAGAAGLPHGALIAGATFGLVTLGSALARN